MYGSLLQPEILCRISVSSAMEYEAVYIMVDLCKSMAMKINLL